MVLKDIRTSGGKVILFSVSFKLSNPAKEKGGFQLPLSPSHCASVFWPVSREPKRVPFS